jgi:hypothetical protein
LIFKLIIVVIQARDLPDDFDECFSKVTGISQATMAEYRARLREGEELLQFRKHGESRSRMVLVNNTFNKSTTLLITILGPRDRGRL